MRIAHETYRLPNGLNVILHPDRRLPQVAINTWFHVGSKDEVPGRTGFAHLFEHLMFMGTARVPGNQFDMLMEGGGGSNNASTSNDRTVYYSVGPSSILPLLLWLDADRLEGLGASMTREKLDLQRDVVRNERRQMIENTPYGCAELAIPEVLYPAGHPYHHPVIGSHEDLEAATLDDVKAFFATHYVPGNASLVVAGDFDPEEVKPVIAATFGAIAAGPVPAHRHAPPLVLERERFRVVTDRVEYPRLYLVWPAPPAYRDGTAELELLAGVLGGGPSSRLEKRLVVETRLAQRVQVYLDERTLGSEFHVEITAADGAGLDAIKRETLAVIDRLAADGPTEAELQRVKAQEESHRLGELESLEHRADHLNAYNEFFGTADGFELDMARLTAPGPERVREWTRRVLGAGRLDLRVVPEGSLPSAIATFGERPANFGAGRFRPPVPECFTLDGGPLVHVAPQAGSGLFSVFLVVDGGERVVPARQAGLSSLAARLALAGAAGRGVAEFAEAVESLGATIDVHASRLEFTFAISGLASRLEPTLDLFADAVLRPNLALADFEREAALALSTIRTRGERPNVVATIAANALVFGRDDVRGRPVDGEAETVSSLGLEDVRTAWPVLVHPGRAQFVVAGDVEPAAIVDALARRFGAWKAAKASIPPRPEPLLASPGARLVFVERPGAPQTVILALAPVRPPDDAQRAARHVLNNVFGGTFTSRLNQNLRETHGYTYGAASAIGQDGPQFVLRATSSVQREVTAAALGEFRCEFDALAESGIRDDELSKAIETAGFDVVEAVQTTHALAGTLADLVADERPLDALARHVRALRAVTLDAANAEARSGLFDWNSLAIVLVGDRSVRAQLAKAGFPVPEEIG